MEDINSRIKGSTIQTVIKIITVWASISNLFALLLRTIICLLKHCIFRAKFLHQKICPHYTDKPNNRLIESGGRCHSDISWLEQCPIYIGINNIGRIIKLAWVLCHLIEQSKIRVKDSSDVQKCQGNNGWHNRWKGNIFNLFPFACSV